eukprot:756461-Hanusia_phi.AAC.8
MGVGGRQGRQREEANRKFIALLPGSLPSSRLGLLCLLLALGFVRGKSAPDAAGASLPCLLILALRALRSAGLSGETRNSEGGGLLRGSKCASVLKMYCT